MKIIVCFKVIPDYDKVIDSDWKGYRFSYAKKNFGVFCEGALESALRIKDSLSDTYLEAITYGEEEEIFIHNLYAAGYDKVTVLSGRNEDFSPRSTARILSEYILKDKYDMVLLGEMVGPNDSGSLPYYLANYLKCPVISNVTEFKYEDRLLAIAEDSEQIYSYEVKEKAVYIVSSAKYAYLRFSTYIEREKAKLMKADKKHVFSMGLAKKYKLRENIQEKKKTDKISIDDLKEMLRGEGNV